MLTLDTLNTMLAVSEEGMVEEMILALLASPQLVIFFEKFPRLKNAVTADLPRWREALRSRLKDARVPPWICPYISRHLLSLNPLLACCRRYSRG
ncbi:hypothetical protein NP214_22735, partial [Salmonella enterica]|nr:hypothetical protein [Salmonella enterica]